MTRIASALIVAATLFASSDTSATVSSWSFAQTPAGLVLRMRAVWPTGCGPEDTLVLRTGNALTLVAKFPDPYVASCGASQLFERDFPVLGTTEGATELRIFYAYAPAFSPSPWHYTVVEGLALPAGWNCCASSPELPQPGVLGAGGATFSVIYSRKGHAWTWMYGSTLRKIGNTIQLYVDAADLSFPESPPSQPSSHTLRLAPGDYKLELYERPFGLSNVLLVATSMLSVPGDPSAVPISDVTPILVALLIASAYLALRRSTRPSDQPGASAGDFGPSCSCAARRY